MSRAFTLASLVLLRLDRVDADRLKESITDSWRMRAED
jgi:hypothetical protein